MKKVFVTFIRIIFILSFFLPFIEGCENEEKPTLSELNIPDSIFTTNELQFSEESWNDVKNEVYKTFLHDTLGLFLDENDSCARSLDSNFESINNPIPYSSRPDSLKNIETSDIVLPPIIEKPLSFILGQFFINFDDSGYEIVIDNSFNKLNVNLLRFSILLLVLSFVNKRLKLIPVLNINFYLNLISYLLLIAFLIIDFEKLLYGFWIFFTCFTLLLINLTLSTFKKNIK